MITSSVFAWKLSIIERLLVDWHTSISMNVLSADAGNTHLIDNREMTYMRLSINEMY